MFEAVYLGATFSDGFRIYNRVELPSFNQTTRAVHESPCDHASESWLLVHFMGFHSLLFFKFAVLHRDFIIKIKLLTLHITLKGRGGGMGIFGGGQDGSDCI